MLDLAALLLLRRLGCVFVLVLFYSLGGFLVCFIGFVSFIRWVLLPGFESHWFDGMLWSGFEVGRW